MGIISVLSELYIWHSSGFAHGGGAGSHKPWCPLCTRCCGHSCEPVLLTIARRTPDPEHLASPPASFSLQAPRCTQLSWLRRAPWAALGSQAAVVYDGCTVRRRARGLEAVLSWDVSPVVLVAGLGLWVLGGSPQRECVLFILSHQGCTPSPRLPRPREP